MMPLSHCEQSNKTTMLKRQTATVEKRFPDFWQILPEWAPNRCLGYSDTSECPENTTLICLLSIVNNMLGALAGVVGFEPTVHATKKRCLTTWLHPISVVEIRKSRQVINPQKG
jgi:hypothetical protein